MSQPSSPESLRVREIAWLEVFPWLRLIGTLRLALRLRLLLLASAGLLLTLFGWWLLGRAFANCEDVQPFVAAYQSCVWNGDRSGVDGWLIPRDQAPGPHLAHWPAWPYRDLWWKLAAPVRQLYAMSTTLVGACFLLLCTLWGLIVWGLFGGAICRAAALQLGREQMATLGESLRFARGKWGSYIAAPLTPLVGSFIVGLPLIIGGFMLRSDWGATVVGVAWPVMLGGGLLIAVFLLGLFFGWPLLFAAVSTEATDSFDAVSRTYSYVQQRPLHYLWYAILATALSWLLALLVDNFALAVIHLTAWTASWGSGGERLTTVLALGESPRLAAQAIWFWQGAVRVLALAALVSHFWVATTGIYLLLRRDTDGQELDEVFVDNAGDIRGLPPMETDPQGVTVVPQSEVTQTG